MLASVGPRTAARMALHLLERDRERGLNLAKTLHQALVEIEHCEYCRNLAEIQPCRICKTSLEIKTYYVWCHLGDLLAIEQSGLFRGRYHCLAGLLSPLEGLGPQEMVCCIVGKSAKNKPDECLVALASTVEGEATTHQIVMGLGTRFVLPVSRRGSPWVVNSIISISRFRR